jgi:peptidoglycan/LPS O-acetylase OafA/YrhL
VIRVAAGLTPVLKNLNFGFTGAHLPHINLLRGIAALLVGFYHFTWLGCEHGSVLPDTNWMHQAGKSGFQGVYIFFVISGFVIPLSMHKAQYSLRKAGRFLLKRSARIEPPYIASIALIIVVFSFISYLYNVTYPIDWTRILLHLGYLIPFTEKYNWYAEIYWTLGVEFQFYLLMALLFVLLDHRRRVFRYAVLALFTCGPLMYQHLAFIPLYGPCFVVGFLLYLLKTNKLNVIELLIFLTAATAMNIMYGDVATAISTLLAFLFIWKVRSESRTGNFFGLVSYSFYLTHGLIGSVFIDHFLDGNETLAARYGLIFAAMLLCVGCATFFWWLIERPSKALSQKIALSTTGTVVRPVETEVEVPVAPL